MGSHLTPRELSERWNCSQKTLTSWRVEGVGPCFLKIGNRIRYRLQDVEAWEEERIYQQIGHPPVVQQQQKMDKE